VQKINDNVVAPLQGSSVNIRFIIDQCLEQQQKMDEKRVLLDSFNSQLIKSDIHKSWLLKKFPTKVLTIALLYRASQHGWSPQDFHALCDNKGHTLTVLKSRPGKIFGGYTTKDWQSSQGVYVDDEKAFLFSIDK
jgi:hypothetical protein